MEKENKIYGIALKIFIGAIIIASIVFIVDYTLIKKEKALKEAEPLVDINTVDSTYYLNKYDLLESSDNIINSKNFVVKIPNDYMISIPDTLKDYKEIILPDTLIYPNISKSNDLDSDGQLYLDPGEFTTFTKRTKCEEIAMNVVVANFKDDIQTLEQCEIVYIDFFIRKDGTSIEIPEVGLNLTKNTNINDKFFTNPKTTFDVSGLNAIQYSYQNGGVIFFFEKDSGNLDSVRVFSNRQIDKFRYHKVYYQG